MIRFTFLFIKFIYVRKCLKLLVNVPFYKKILYKIFYKIREVIKNININNISHKWKKKIIRWISTYEEYSSGSRLRKIRKHLME